MKMEEEYEKVLKETVSEFSDFELVQKQDSTLMKVIDVILKVITFGQMKSFMGGFITTLGNKMYVPQSWSVLPAASKAKIIRHERIHMRQSKKYTRILFSIMYLFLPLPIGVAFFRKKFEQEAYEESLIAINEYLGEKALLSPELKKNIVDHFTTANYFWMWPFKKNVEAWYDSVVKKILDKK